MSAIQMFAEQAWVTRLGWTLVHFLWQGAAIAALYGVARRWVGPSRSAQIRYLLGCAALTTMLAAPLVTFSTIGAADSAPKNPYVGTLPLSSLSPRYYKRIATVSLPALAVHVRRADVMPWIVIALVRGRDYLLGSARGRLYDCRANALDVGAVSPRGMAAQVRRNQNPRLCFARGQVAHLRARSGTDGCRLGCVPLC